MSFRKNFNPSVYFVADPAACGEREISDVIGQAVAGGVTMIQLRYKKLHDDARFLDLAKMLAYMLKPVKIPFIINDRVDIAMASGADGVHLGQEDFPPAEARKLLGPDKIIGVTAYTARHFRYIEPAIVDYAGAGPFYPTKTKPNKPVLGVTKFKSLVELATVPVVGVGGITPANAPTVIKSGADGVAMMRGISASANPEKTTRAYVAAVAAARGQKIA